MGMFVVLAAALSLSALPPLPDQGLALDTRAGVQLQTLAGIYAVSLNGKRRLLLRTRQPAGYAMWGG
jgi:hypothetical protein